MTHTWRNPRPFKKQPVPQGQCSRTHGLQVILLWDPKHLKTSWSLLAIVFPRLLFLKWLPDFLCFCHQEHYAPPSIYIIRILGPGVDRKDLRGAVSSPFVMTEGMISAVFKS